MQLPLYLAPAAPAAFASAAGAESILPAEGEEFIDEDFSSSAEEEVT